MNIRGCGAHSTMLGTRLPIEEVSKLKQVPRLFHTWSFKRALIRQKKDSNVTVKGRATSKIRPSQISIKITPEYIEWVDFIVDALQDPRYRVACKNVLVQSSLQIWRYWLRLQVIARPLCTAPPDVANASSPSLPRRDEFSLVRCRRHICEGSNTSFFHPSLSLNLFSRVHNRTKSHRPSLISISHCNEFPVAKSLLNIGNFPPL